MWRPCSTCLGAVLGVVHNLLLDTDEGMRPHMVLASAFGEWGTATLRAFFPCMG